MIYHKFIKKDNYFIYNESIEFKTGRTPNDNDSARWSSLKLPTKKAGHVLTLQGSKIVNVSDTKTVYHKTLYQPIKLNYGEAIPDYATDVTPPEDTRRHIFDDALGQWVIDLESIKLEKINAINAEAKKAIEAGFEFENLYIDSELEDQFNIQTLMSIGGDHLIRCADATGVKEFRPFTEAQIKNLVVNFTAHKSAILGKASDLKSTIAGATTEGEIEAVNWISGDL